ncbi:class I SAM-dependent methyltransferase [Pseudoalteromonas fenneropenaei]|uniref:Class I SAM-dependent methyltransferase n=1 Tax=Pseudoalteromonas fenneropenaei TaxID=1737459 RepID=A0ABV7CK18_9GAMM
MNRASVFVQPCGLCGHSQPLLFSQDKRRQFWQCQHCHLVYVAQVHYLSAADEKAIYDQHENCLEDEGYRRFLSRAAVPVQEKVKLPATGLDFGCGPGPLLARMLTEYGYSMQCYDLYYANNVSVLDKYYDFITCTEVIEHIATPNQTLARLLSMLKPGAPLVLMTKLVLDAERFANWHYKNDLTHISFFSRATFDYIARHYDVGLEFIGNDVIVLTKYATSTDVR